MSARKIVEVVFLGSTADLEGKELALADTTDEMSKRMGGSILGMTNTTGGAMSKLGSKLQAWGVPFSSVFIRAGEKMDTAGSKAKKLGTAVQTAGGVILASSLVAGAAVAGESLRMGMAYQTSEADIATYAGISQKKADLIGKAFLGTAFKVQYTAQQISDAFAATAGQFGELNGRALNTKQSMTVMTAAINLAEATQKNLGESTAALASVMQQFHIPIGSVNTAVDVLYNTSRKLGIGLPQVTKQVQQMAARMGALSPTIQQMGGLLVDLTAHHETGRMAMRAMNSMITKIIQPSNNYITALSKQNVLMKQLGPQYQTLAKEMLNGSATTEQVSMTTQYMTQQQKQLFTAFQSQVTATESAKESMSEYGITAFNAQHKFIGWTSIFSQLKNNMAGLNGQQAKLAYLTEVLGPQASLKMLNTIEAGGAALKKYTDQVSKKGSAEAAAALQEKTLQHMVDQLRAGLEDLGVKLGQWLIPKFKSLAHEVTEVVQWFEKHKQVALALVAVITGVLGAAVGAYLVGKFVQLGKSIRQGYRDIKMLATGFKDSIVWIKNFAKAMMTSSDETVAAAGESEVAVTGLAETTETAAVGIDSALASTGIGAALIAIGLLVGYLATHWKQAWQTIKMETAAVWSFLDNDIFHPIVHFFTIQWEAITSTATKAWRTLWNGMKSIASGVWGGIKAILNAVIDAIDDVIKGWNAVVGHIPFFGGGMKVPVIPQVRATGGSVSALQPYIVGEKGPELFVPSTPGTVMPNSSLRTGVGAGAGASIVINGYNLANPSQTANEIAWKLKTAPAGAY